MIKGGIQNINSKILLEGNCGIINTNHITNLEKSDVSQTSCFNNEIIKNVNPKILNISGNMKTTNINYMTNLEIFNILDRYGIDSESIINSKIFNMKNSRKITNKSYMTKLRLIIGRISN